MNIPKIVGELIIFGVLLVWIAWWTNIAWQNYTLGDMTGTAITVVAFVLTAVVLLLWRARTIPSRFSAV